MVEGSEEARVKCECVTIYSLGNHNFKISESLNFQKALDHDGIVAE